MERMIALTGYRQRGTYDTIHGFRLRSCTILLQRFLAMLVLGATIYSSAESALALTGDGRLHHDAVRAADARPNGEMAAERSSEKQTPANGDGQHDGGRRHGTLADHCTHSHAVGPVAFVRWDAAPLAHADAVPAFVASYSDADPRHALRPPRA